MRAKPVDLSTPITAGPRVAAALHSITPDGRVMHSFSKVDGTWVCACGERRDRFGSRLK